MHPAKFQPGDRDKPGRPGRRSGSRSVPPQARQTDSECRAAANWRAWEFLVADACACGVCGGDWERVLNLTPARLSAILTANTRISNIDQLEQLCLTNRAMVAALGERGCYEELAQRYWREIRARE